MRLDTRCFKASVLTLGHSTGGEMTSCGLNAGRCGKGQCMACESVAKQKLSWLAWSQIALSVYESRAVFVRLDHQFDHVEPKCAPEALALLISCTVLSAHQCSLRISARSASASVHEYISTTSASARRCIVLSAAENGAL